MLAVPHRVDRMGWQKTIHCTRSTLPHYSLHTTTLDPKRSCWQDDQTLRTHAEKWSYCVEETDNGFSGLCQPKWQESIRVHWIGHTFYLRFCRQCLLRQLWWWPQWRQLTGLSPDPVWYFQQLRFWVRLVHFVSGASLSLESHLQWFCVCITLYYPMIAAFGVCRRQEYHL